MSTDKYLNSSTRFVEKLHTSVQTTSMHQPTVTPHAAGVIIGVKCEQSGII